MCTNYISFEIDVVQKERVANLLCLTIRMLSGLREIERKDLSCGQKSRKLLQRKSTVILKSRKIMQLNIQS